MFVVLMALSVLGLFAVQAACGLPVDASLTIGFGLVVAVAAVLAGIGLRPGRERVAAGRPRSIPLAG